MKILGAEYNEYVVGYVISTDKGDVNAQFEKVFSNHPEPAFKLKIGCEGDSTADKFTDDERDQISVYISENEEMRTLASDFTKAYYNGSDLPDLIAPISAWQISERAEIDE
jgi:hypothetical protein